MAVFANIQKKISTPFYTITFFNSALVKFFVESYVNKNHSNDFVWYFDDDGPWIQKPTGKGDRLIIINAITKNGWVPGAKLTFKSSRKTGDYHGQFIESA
jgi:hypothetical protein